MTRYAVAYKPSKKTWLVLDNTKNNSTYGGGEVSDTNAIARLEDAEMAQRIVGLLNADQRLKEQTRLRA